MNQTPAGWYADPNSPQLQRYWDGSRWTEHTAPAYGQGHAVAQPGLAVGVVNPYDKRYDLGQLSEEQREGYRRNTLTSFPTWVFIVLTILTLGIFGTIYHGLKHSKLPEVKSDDFGAGKGIGFLLIPFFNLYWVFIFWLRLVDRINFQYRLRGAPDPVSRDLTLWTVILIVASVIIPFAGLVAPIMALVVGGQIQSAANRLASGEVDAAGYTGAAIAQGGYQQPAQAPPAQPAHPAQQQEPPPPRPPSSS